MKSIVIYSPYDCIVKYNNQEDFLDQNQHLIINGVDVIYVYPIGKTKRYSFAIDMKNNENQFYTILERNDKYLVFLLDGLYSQNIDIYNFKNNNTSSTIEISSQSVTFSTGKHKKIISLTATPKKITCGNFSFIDYCLIENLDNSTLIAYNVKTNKAKQFKGKDIKLLDKGFMVSRVSSFYEKIDEEYYVDNDGLKIKNKSHILSEQSYPNELLPYRFMSAVKCGDTSQFNKLLSPKLLEKISEEDIKNYFGNIEYFYMIDYKTCFAISEKEQVLYEFIVDNDKIAEIIDNKN